MDVVTNGDRLMDFLGEVLRPVHLVALLAALAVGGCGEGAPTAPGTSLPAPASASTSPTPTLTPLASADISACKAYLRVEPKVSDMLDNVGELPTSLSQKVFDDYADDLETGAGTARNERLTEPMDSTIAALRAMAATIRDYRAGTLDLSAEATALFEASSDVAAACAPADPGQSYRGMLSSDN